MSNVYEWLLSLVNDVFLLVHISILDDISEHKATTLSMAP